MTLEDLSQFLFFLLKLLGGWYEVISVAPLLSYSTCHWRTCRSSGNTVVFVSWETQLLWGHKLSVWAHSEWLLWRFIKCAWHKNSIKGNLWHTLHIIITTIWYLYWKPVNHLTTDLNDRGMRFIHDYLADAIHLDRWWTHKNTTNWYHLEITLFTKIKRFTLHRHAVLHN